MPPDAPQVAASQTVRELEPGKPIERELAGGQVHTYRVTLAAGQYLHVVVDQRGIDVVVRLFGPDGQQLDEADSLNGVQGPEPVSLVAETSGDYRLEVRSLNKEATPGRYEVKIEELREATPRDRNRFAAQKAFAEGMRLHAQRTAESRRKAIGKFEEALRLLQTVGDPQAEAATLNGIAVVYDDLGEPRKALEYYNQAAPLYRVVNDRGGEATTLNNMGVVYNSLGEPQKALECYGQALSLHRAVGNRRGEALALSGIGRIYHLLDEPQKAFHYYNQALTLRRAVGDRRGEAQSLTGIGLVYDDLGEPQKALDYLNQALPLYRAVGDPRGEAATLHNMGAMYNSLGEPQKALDYFGQALSLSRSIGDRYGEASTLTRIGMVYFRLNQKEKAIEYLNQALSLRQAVGHRSGEANTLHNIGAVYASMGEKKQALDYYGRALSLRRAVGDRSGEANTLYGIAHLERDRGNLTEARAEIEAALNIIESLRTKVAGQELRAFYLASKQNYYEFYIDLLMRLHKLNPPVGHDAAALQASERARARSLLETLTEARADIRQGVDPALLERERNLQQQLNAKEQYRMQLLSGKPTDEQKAAAEKELRDLLTQYQEVQAQIRASSPRYAALAQPQPLSLKEIQQQVLDEDTLLLEYALGEEHSYLWAVTPTSINSFELPKRTEIETAARRVYDLLNARNRREKSEEDEQKAARVAKADAEYPIEAAKLSQMLLGPVAAQLGKKRLLIVADGALQYIPFAALPRPLSVVSGQLLEKEKNNRQRTTGNGQPLIVDHEIVSLPSASVLAVLRKELAGRTPAPKTVAALADPVFSKNDLRVKRSQTKAEKKPGETATQSQNITILEDALTRSTRELGIESFIRLRWSGQEANAITALAPKGSYLKALDFAASRVTATSPDLSQYRIVHLATHGLLNSQHPELSGLVLSLVNEQGQSQDGFVRLHEIYNLKLNADLVVLSACQTALGKEIKGEGLVGLTRGFMYAGAARVVASLWSVDDKATAELMRRFYKAMLQEGQRPAAALRAAQISMWKEKNWPAPYYWAGFVLQGEWK